MSNLSEALGEFFPQINTMDKKPPLEVVKTPWPLLNDHILGCGGIPRGRSIELYAAPSVGKTTFAINLMAAYQSLGLSCAFDDREGAFQEEKYTKGTGLDRSELINMDTADGTDALFQAQLMIALNAVDLYVIDSVASILPDDASSVESGKDLNMKQKLSRAGLLTTFFSRLRSGFEIGKPGTAKKTGGWNQSNMIEADKVYLKDGAETKFLHKLTDKKTTLIMINHYKKGIGPYAKGTTPGGVSGEFDATIRLRLIRKKVSKKLIDGTPEFKIVEIKADKNKVGPPGRAGLFKFYWNGKIEEWKASSKDGNMEDASEEE